MSLDTVHKAVTAAAVAFVGAVVTAYTDGAVSPAEWWAAAGAGLGGYALVWRVPNAPTPALVEQVADAVYARLTQMPPATHPAPAEAPEGTEGPSTSTMPRDFPRP